MRGNARTIRRLSIKAGRSGRFIAILQSDVPSAMTGVPMWILQKKAPRTSAFVDMDSNEIDVVKAFIAAINKGNVAELSSLMTEDHTFVDSGGRVESGRDNMANGWSQYFRMFPDYRIEVQSILHDRSLVAVFGSAAGTYNGKRGLVPENRIEMLAAWKAIVENGKIKLWQVYTDWTEGSKIIEEDKAQG